MIKHIVAALLIPIVALLAAPRPRVERAPPCPGLTPIARVYTSTGRMVFTTEALIPGQCQVVSGVCSTQVRQVVVLQVTAPVVEFPGSYIAVVRDTDQPGITDPSRTQIIAGPGVAGEALSATAVEYVTPGKFLTLLHYRAVSGQGLVLDAMYSWGGPACQ